MPVSRKPQKPRTAKPPRPPIDPDSEVARLKKANRDLRGKLSELTKWHEAEMLREGKMPLATFRAIAKCLHPDRSPPTQKERPEACKLFNAWKDRR